MNRFFVGIVVILLFGFAKCAEPAACVAEKRDEVNTKVQAIIDGLVGAGLATQDPSSLKVSIEDENIPQMLETICTNALIKDAMLQLQTLIGSCAQLLLAGDVKLQLIEIKGVKFAQLFVSFLSVDQFCVCQSHLPTAWVVREATLPHSDADSIYNTIGDGSKICGVSTEITAVAGITGTCADSIKSQAGFGTTDEKAKFARLSDFVNNHCSNFDADAWNCSIHSAYSADSTNCKAWALGLDQNKGACAKRKCVTTFIGGPCTGAASDIYIDAVNIETPSALLQSSATCSDNDVECITYASVMAINEATMKIVAGLAQYITSTSSGPTVADEDIPAVFTKLCNNVELRREMAAIETKARECPSTVLLATGLRSLTLKDVSFGQFFTMFAGIDAFCECSGALPAAWALREDTTSKVYADPEAAFSRVSDVGNICGSTLKPLITSISGAAATCKTVLKQQAGFTGNTANDFDKMNGIAEKCGANTGDDWDCVIQNAKKSAFKSCISNEDNKEGDQSRRCGKWECVKVNMHVCSNDARELYIKAVNAENTNAIKVDGTGCDGACGLQMSLLVLAACFLFLRL